MKRIALTAALLATFGLAAAATAGEHQKPRTAAVYGRKATAGKARASRSTARTTTSRAHAANPGLDLQRGSGPGYFRAELK